MVYDFGIRLRDLRNKEGLTQKQVAQRVGVTRAAIGTYENNIASPPLNVLIKLTLLYKTTADYLLGLEDRPVFLLDGLTESQQKRFEIIANAFIEECKSSENKSTTDRT